ncbi:Modification methylase HhaI [Streptomyces sp. YIM 121038]|uniref:DNA cytosine methyltransferase n=1 Tax=Streptomyces sp. YIM 121038 TaxID=2136401 RepID=UPI0011102202|nr:DNA cytosine methyltransferase [Streptomyces sp. YIM 121038]QCX81185.1 Modification methylase HhaI [Streptomyces sp. YIM 121038]
MTNLSLCSGFGGLDIAVEQITGNKTLVYAENDPFAAQVMAARFPHATNLGDITAINWAGLAQDHHFDTVTAGFPCQGLSNAGLRKGFLDARSALWKNVAEAVRVLRPHLVFLENVAAIRSRGLGEVVADLAQVGYDARWTCVRAGDPAVGAPHPRDRWFLIAHPAAEDPDSAAWRQRWPAAPRQAESRGARTDPGGRGRLLAAAPAGGIALLPTPKASDGPNGGPNQRDGQGNYYLPGMAVRLGQDWVAHDGTDYGPAIRRWESVLGRRAPFPTEPGSRGNRRLTPPFVEWLMGAPEGWVTGLGLPRAQQLKILGNGVVTLQAIEGYRRLLCADLEAMAA